MVTATASLFPFGPLRSLKKEAGDMGTLLVLAALGFALYASKKVTPPIASKEISIDTFLPIIPPAPPVELLPSQETVYTETYVNEVSKIDPADRSAISGTLSPAEVEAMGKALEAAGITANMSIGLKPRPATFDINSFINYWNFLIMNYDEILKAWYEKFKPGQLFVTINPIQAGMQSSIISMEKISTDTWRATMSNYTKETRTESGWLARGAELEAQITKMKQEIWG